MAAKFAANGMFGVWSITGLRPAAYGFGQALWPTSHATLRGLQRPKSEAYACAAYVEGQDIYQRRGNTAALAHCSHRVDHHDATIIDVKTRREQPWHSVQVIIYQYALPLALPQYRNVRIGGEVIYPTHTVRIPRGKLPSRFTQDLGALIRLLAADTPPKRVPSAVECRFCDITAADCPERMDAAIEAVTVVTDDF